jgi:hypothetical protein
MAKDHPLNSGLPRKDLAPESAGRIKDAPAEPGFSLT